MAATVTPVELYHRFVEDQPAALRDEVGRMPIVVVLGERARGGRSELVEAGVRWRGNMRPSLYEDDAPVRFYHGNDLVAVELAIAAVDDETPPARDGLAGLFGELRGRDISAVVVVERDTLDPAEVDALRARAERIRAKLDLLAGSVGAGVDARLCIAASLGGDGFDDLAHVLAGAGRGVPIEVAAAPPSPVAIRSALAGVLPYGLATLPVAAFDRLVGFLASADGFASALSAFLAAFAAPAVPPHTVRLIGASLFASDRTLVGAPFPVLDRSRPRPVPGLSWRHVVPRCIAAAACASLPFASIALAGKLGLLSAAPPLAPPASPDGMPPRAVDAGAAPLGVVDGAIPAMLGGTPANATPYFMGFDIDTPVSAKLAGQLHAEGYRFCIRYVSLGGQESSSDLTTAEAKAILGAGLALMAVQHVNSNGWMPTESLGTLHGKDAAHNADLIGFPRGVNLWMDLEGVNASASVSDVSAYAGAWRKVVLSSGFQPGIYVGAHTNLTWPMLLTDLDYEHYWRSLSTVPDVAMRGYQMVQWAGRGYDNNRTQDDDFGGQVRWLAPESHRYPTLQKGDQNVAGEVIESLQLALKAAGATLTIAKNPRFDDNTESAVKTFQSANGLAPSGIVSDETWAKLISVVRRR